MPSKWLPKWKAGNTLTGTLRYYSTTLPKFYGLAYNNFIKYGRKGNIPIYYYSRNGGHFFKKYLSEW